MVRRFQWMAGVLVLLLTFTSPAVADDTKELERRFDILSEEFDEFRQKSGGGEDSKITIHGYGEVHFSVLTDGSSENQFDSHRFVIGVHAELADWIHLNAEIDFEHAAQEMEFEFGYLDFLIDPAYNFRTGVMLAPIGYLNEFHEPPLFWSVERSDFQKRIIPTTWNLTGAGVFGTPVDGVNYRVYVTNSLDSIGTSMPADGFRGLDGIRKGRQAPDHGLFENIAVSGRVELSKLAPGMAVGVSFFYGNTTQDVISEGGATLLLEADVKYRKRWFEVLASIAHIDISDAGAINADKLALGSTDIASSAIFGYNVQAGVHLPQLMGWSTTHDVIPFVMYDFTDTQNDMPDGFVSDPKNRKKITTVGVSYLPIPAVALKFDFQSTKLGNGNNEERVNFGMAYMY